MIINVDQQLINLYWKRFRCSLNAKADNMTSTVNMEDFRLLLTQMGYYTFSCSFHDIAGIGCETQHVAKRYIVYSILFQRGFQASKDAICCEINDSHSIKVASSDNSIDGIKNAHQDGKKLTGAH